MTFDDYEHAPNVGRPIASGFCACGIRLPLGPWEHPDCPRCRARTRAEVALRDPLGISAVPSAPERSLIANLTGWVLALAAMATVGALLAFFGA